jgi:type IV secretion system protein VirD4
MNEIKGGKLFIKNGAISITILMIPVIGFLIVMFEPKSRNRYGDARFARNNEIKKYGYFVDKGIIVGQTKWLGRLLWSYGPKTVGLSAKPRSGKGVSMVVPNLLTWDGSVVVVDVKKELFEITSGYRSAQGQKIIVFDPMDRNKKSHCINIFDDVSRDPERTGSDVDKIAKAIIPIKDNFWDGGSQSLFKGIALYLIETKQHVSLGSIYRFANDGINLQEKFLAILEQEKDLSEECVAQLKAYGNEESEKVAGGFFQGFNQHMKAFGDPLIAAATDKSDFDFSKLREEKTTVYLVVRPEHMSILGKVFGLIVETIVFALTRHKPKKDEKGKVMIMCDEFTALGKLIRIKDGAAYFGGYGIRLVMIYQNEAQLQSTYTPVEARELMGLMHERVIFAPSDIDEAAKLSKELGNMTIKTTNRSYSQGRISKSISESAKALMTPEKLLLLPNHLQLILASEQRPIFCKKIFYYKDKRFKNRLLPSYAEEVPRLKVMKYKFKNIETLCDDSIDATLDEMVY